MIRDINKIQISKNYITWINTIVFIAVFATIIFGYSYLDNILLVEKQRPDYWNYLAREKNEQKVILQSTAQIEKRRNLIINTLNTIEGNGFSIYTRDDGAIVFSGTNMDQAKNTYVFSSGGCNDCSNGGFFILTDGKYIFSDGGESKDNGISLYIEGIRYSIGGKKRSEVIAELTSDKKEEVFEVNSDEYDFIDCKISVEPGYSAKEIVLYPMIKRNSDTDSKYEPCIAPNANYEENSDTSSYLKYYMSKEDLDKVSIDDFQFFVKNLKNSYRKCSWFSLQFMDGTGLYISNDSVDEYKYGRMNSAGLIVDEGESIDPGYRIVDQIDRDNARRTLREETDFGRYLSKIKGKNHVIFVSIRDDGTVGLTPQTKEKIREFGIKTDFSGKKRYSFVAILDEDNMIYEKCTKARIVSEGDIDNGPHYRVYSSGFDGGAESSIIVDGEEYSMNKRGMNFVIYDKEKAEVIDTVTFDTWSKCGAYRMV